MNTCRILAVLLACIPLLGARPVAATFRASLPVVDDRSDPHLRRCPGWAAGRRGHMTRAGHGPGG